MRTAPKRPEEVNPTSGNSPAPLPHLARARVQARTLGAEYPPLPIGTWPVLAHDGHSSPAFQAAATREAGKEPLLLGGGRGGDPPERRVRPLVRCLQQLEKATTLRPRDPTRGLASSEKRAELPWSLEDRSSTWLAGSVNWVQRPAQPEPFISAPFPPPALRCVPPPAARPSLRGAQP